MTGSELPQLPTSVRRLANRRQLEIERLLRLMGGMLADAYVDVCTIVEERPGHRTASHLLAHLAREIDSGLRELLTAMLPPERRNLLEALPKERDDSRDPPRSAVIAEICSFLRIPEETGVQRAWSKLNWHGRAHRNALRVPRVLDDELLKSWNDFVNIMLIVGRGFEAIYLVSCLANS